MKTSSDESHWAIAGRPSISPAAPKQPVIHSRIMVMSVRGTNTTGNSRVKGEEGKQWP